MKSLLIAALTLAIFAQAQCMVPPIDGKDYEACEAVVLFQVKALRIVKAAEVWSESETKEMVLLADFTILSTCRGEITEGSLICGSADPAAKPSDDDVLRGMRFSVLSFPSYPLHVGHTYVGMLNRANGARTSAIYEPRRYWTSLYAVDGDESGTFSLTRGTTKGFTGETKPFSHAAELPALLKEMSANEHGKAADDSAPQSK